MLLISSTKCSNIWQRFFSQLAFGLALVNTQFDQSGIKLLATKIIWKKLRFELGDCQIKKRKKVPPTLKCTKGI